MTCFISEEIKNSAARIELNGIPYRPLSNGPVEKVVQNAKQNLSRLDEGACKLIKMPVLGREEERRKRGKAPCELLMGRRLRSALDSTH